MFDPNVAKWIIFLYHNGSNTTYDSRGNKPQLLIFPNPANRMVEINLEYSNSNKIEYRIFDSSGILVEGGSITSEIHQLDLSDINPGMYFLQLSEKNKNIIATKKIIIQ